MSLSMITLLTDFQDKLVLENNGNIEEDKCLNSFNFAIKPFNRPKFRLSPSVIIDVFNAKKTVPNVALYLCNFNERLDERQFK